MLSQNYKGFGLIIWLWCVVLNVCVWVCVEVCVCVGWLYNPSAPGCAPACSHLKAAQRLYEATVTLEQSELDFLPKKIYFIIVLYDIPSFCLLLL